MALNIDKEVARVQRMTVRALQEEFAQVFNEQARSHHKIWLIKRIAWRMQANEEGGLSERALRRAAELANDADLRLSAPRPSKNGDAVVTYAPIVAPTDSRLPMPGTLITRKYKGQTIQVKVLSDGFEYEGERYKSLSGVARAVTGGHWNGFHFFGLSKGAVTK